MEYHDHNYSKNYKSPENELQTNVSQMRMGSDGRYIVRYRFYLFLWISQYVQFFILCVLVLKVDSRRYQECSSHVIHDRGTEQFLWEQVILYITHHLVT